MYCIHHFVASGAFFHHASQRFSVDATSLDFYARPGVVNTKFIVFGTLGARTRVFAPPAVHVEPVLRSSTFCKARGVVCAAAPDAAFIEASLRPLLGFTYRDHCQRPTAQLLNSVRVAHPLFLLFCTRSEHV
jgi:hypothetical protein